MTKVILSFLSACSLIVSVQKKYLKNVNASKFVAMDDSDYDIIRDLKAAKDAKKN